MTKHKLIKSYDESGNIRTFVFEKGDLSWVAGQYQKWTLNQVEGDDKAKSRWFTIAAAPQENELHISTRMTDSAFKQTLNSLKSGDEIETDELGGDFTWDGTNQIVAIAGGIGVTPFRSMIVELDKSGKDVPMHLLYYGRDENLAFRNEFDDIASRHSEFKIDYIIGEHISSDGILAHAPEASTTPTYLSGPEAMVDSVGETLKANGVNLKQDWFPGYDENTY